ncbi:cap-specific mRNA (nucleoside-2'-O-)-methyltransferase 1 [Anopheles aquasalis]|uniref:cap-specific mRNA (nucleoside-2'-O-)-methyltransferase 1 n=1 Tax=Anopheles aquasalis TaxID=42839 RepID=UPI00215AEF20|nr:cap-specific mRNA (nucleoside-2'-O-)-methyltransferase 1 [Anopheles aquasalis]
MANTLNLWVEPSEEQEALSGGSPPDAKKRRILQESDAVRGNEAVAAAAASGVVTDPPADPKAPSSGSSFGQFSEKSVRMMQQMGYKAGTGLGKSGQGRIDLIETSSQKGRSGLGMKMDQLDSAATQFDATEEVITMPEEIVWLYNCSKVDDPEITQEQLNIWLVIGPAKRTIDDETRFCDPKVLQQIIEGKSVFDLLGAGDMRKARYRSNPFELIRNNIFMNRAAVKLANLDSMCNWTITQPLDRDGQLLVKDDEVFYFADVCAGPGGFSEYMLWRKGWRAKGFGFTLRALNDFKLEAFIAGTPETFDPYYGPHEDGNIYDPVNIDGFSEYVLSQTNNGVHLMLADGGISVENEENIQEILTKQLFLCQVIVALDIVRPNGSLVLKVFDQFTPFSVGLVYLLYRCFAQISICKPNSSRPANSERYIVCKWKKSNAGIVAKHLKDVNRRMFEKADPETDILELVADSVIREDREFFEYVRNSNDQFGRNQVNALQKIAAFCRNRDLVESRQHEVKNRCLELWSLPDASRTVPKTKGDPDQYIDKFYEIWRTLAKSVGLPERSLVPDLRVSFPSAHDWYFVPIGNANNQGKNLRSMLLGKGGKEVYKFDAKQRSWTLVKDIAIELPPKTIIYGEIVRELQGEGKSQIVINTLHIIDGLVLGGEDIRCLPLAKRNARCHQFAKALTKPITNTGTGDVISTASSANTGSSLQIRAKQLYSLFDMEMFFSSLKSCELKAGNSRLGYRVTNIINPDRLYVPYGLLFLREVKPDYMKTLSKKQNKFYYFHTKTKESRFPEQFNNQEKETLATFDETFHTRLFWEWTHVHQVQTKVEEKRCDQVYRVDFNNYLKTNYSC